MKLKIRTIKYLNKLILGDNSVETDYKSGPELVEFFNQFGFDDIYGKGFPPRYQYGMDKLKTLNGTKQLKELIKDFFNPVNFIEKDDELFEKTLNKINKYLYYDNYKIEIEDNEIKIINLEKNKVILSDNIALSEKIEHLIEKYEKRLADGDYKGVIGGVNNLLEEFFDEIYQKTTNGKSLGNGKDLTKDWKKLQKELNLAPKDYKEKKKLIKIVGALSAIIDSFDNVVNDLGERHRGVNQPDEHHARFVLDSAKTLINFVYASYEKQYLDK